jgi:hypothetical protein
MTLQQSAPDRGIDTSHPSLGSLLALNGLFENGVAAEISKFRLARDECFGIASF